MAKELKHLNRRELIEIIYQLKIGEQELQAENKQLQKQLEEKRIILAEAGSVAEAALELTDIFQNAQRAADVYLAEIAERRNDMENEYDTCIEEANQKANDILNRAVRQRDTVIAETRKAYELFKQYETMIDQKKKELALYSSQEKQR